MRMAVAGLSSVHHEIARIAGRIFNTQRKPRRIGRSLPRTKWIKDVRKYSCGSPRPYVDRFGSAWENKHLPALPISDSALVLALPGLRREAELAEIENSN